MMPNHSPPPGQSPICVALVSGPRIVTVILPCSLLTTSSQRLAAMERNGCAPSLWQRQIRSTKGESDGLSSSKIIIAYPLELKRLHNLLFFLNNRNLCSIKPASYSGGSV